MTNHDYTALLLIVDRSGSMAIIRDDMVGGLEGLLAKQAAQPGPTPCRSLWSPTGTRTPARSGRCRA